MSSSSGENLLSFSSEEAGEYHINVFYFKNFHNGAITLSAFMKIFLGKDTEPLGWVVPVYSHS